MSVFSGPLQHICSPRKKGANRCLLQKEQEETGWGSAHRVGTGLEHCGLLLASPGARLFSQRIGGGKGEGVKVVSAETELKRGVLAFEATCG